MRSSGIVRSPTASRGQCKPGGGRRGHWGFEGAGEGRMSAYPATASTVIWVERTASAVKWGGTAVICPHVEVGQGPTSGDQRLR